MKRPWLQHLGLIGLLLGVMAVGTLTMWLYGPTGPDPVDDERWAALHRSDPELRLEPWLGAMRLARSEGTANPVSIGYAFLLGNPRFESDVEAATGAPQVLDCASALPAWLPRPSMPAAAVHCLQLLTTHGEPRFLSLAMHATQLEDAVRQYTDAMNRASGLRPAGSTRSGTPGADLGGAQTWTWVDGTRRVDMRYFSDQWIKAPNPSGLVVIRWTGKDS
ncbi:MAG: hypothetical protein JNK67_12465 [Alphaproteobacteria bacterium]|nr:hypothetical protein [Alphaproteobacteria bacterium]